MPSLTLILLVVMSLPSFDFEWDTGRHEFVRCIFREQTATDLASKLRPLLRPHRSSVTRAATPVACHPETAWVRTVEIRLRFLATRLGSLEIHSLLLIRHMRSYQAQVQL